MAASIAFVPELGPSIGLGHLVRALALAERCVEVGLNSSVLVARDRLHLVPRFGTRFVMPVDDSRAETLRHDVVVFDSEVVPDETLESARANAAVVLIDDLASGPRPVDLLVNPDAPDAWLVEGVPTAGGLRYLPLRPCRRRTRRHSNPPSFLIAAGGVDPTGLAETAMAVLSGLQIVAKNVVVLRGPSQAALPIPAELASHVQVTIVEDPSDPMALFSQVDLAVTAGGMTMYELVASGTACVAVPVVPSQELAVQRLAGAGAVIGVEPDQVSFGDAITSLFDQERADALRRAGASLIDGRGTERVVQLIARLVR